MAYCFRVEVVLLLTCSAFFCVTYVTSYQNFTITHPKICSLTEKKGKIKLTDYSDAAIVEETRSFDKWSGHKRFHCEFEVKGVHGDKDHAVFAVIQNLKFRKSERGCIDYVEFEDDEQTSGKLCGELGPSISPSLNFDDGAIAPYAFIGSDEVDVTVHVATERGLLPGEEIDLKIAFTSARKCDSRGKWPFHSKPSTPTISCGNNTYCISAEYGMDSIVNCPFALCKDEGECPSSIVPAYHRPSVGTRMTIGAITTVLASFLVFFACIWILRHYRKLCWSSDFSGQREVRMTPVPPVPSGPESLEAGTARQENVRSPAPTAPPLDSTGPTIIPDKDLPPPYESLFPPSSR